MATVPVKIELTAEDVLAGRHRGFDPQTHDFFWHDDGGCTVVRLPYWDDASYARWQGDPYGSGGGEDDHPEGDG